MKPLKANETGSILRHGSRVFVAPGCTRPDALVALLCERAEHLYDVEFVSGYAPESLSLPQSRAEGLAFTFFHYDPYISLNEPNAGAPRPCASFKLPRMILENAVGIDVALIAVSPPDPHGFCSLGPHSWATLAACEAADIVIAQVNAQIQPSRGETALHVSAIDYSYEHEAPLLEEATADSDPVDAAIGRNFSYLVDDRSAVASGAGMLADHALAALAHLRELRLCGEVLGNGGRTLAEAGCLATGGLARGLGACSVSTVLGPQSLYDYVARNPLFRFQPVDACFEAASGSAFVQVLPSTEVDLYGRVRLVNQPGRFLFTLGSTEIPDTPASAIETHRVALLRSTRQNRNEAPRSCIHFGLAAGEGLLTDRIQTIVTEYGIARLWGRRREDRAKALIEVAHPEFRDELLRESQRRKLVAPTFRLAPLYLPEKGANYPRRERLRDGQAYLVRPLTAADDHRLQEFFYSHTEDTIHRRYGFTVSRMSPHRALELVAIDQNRDFALGVFQLHGPREVLHGVGRFFLDPDGRSAEMAFVTSEDKRRVGMGRFLLEELFTSAQRRGVHRLWAHVDRDNIPMLQLFAEYEPDTSEGEEEGTILVSFLLNPRKKPERKRYSVLKRYNSPIS